MVFEDDVRGAVDELLIEMRELRVRFSLQHKCLHELFLFCGTIVLLVLDAHDTGDPGVGSGLLCCHFILIYKTKWLGMHVISICDLCSECLCFFRSNLNYQNKK